MPRLPERAILARVLPFAAYIACLALEQDLPVIFGPILDWRWFYAVKVSLAAGLLAYFWRDYRELFPKTRPSLAAMLPAALVGGLICVLWIRLDSGWMVMGEMGQGFSPIDNGRYNVPLMAVRLAGASLVVPLIEELFWRSFLMRWLDSRDFLGLAPIQVGLPALLGSSLVFGFEHHQWLAGVIAGLAYGQIYRRSQQLWLAVLAHAVTNLSLGVWVMQTGNWQFW